MNKKALVISIITTFFYALVTLNTVLHHEVWADEAQVWMLCKNLSIPELFNHLKNEGHPIFFYLLTMPFAKLFPDIIFMKLICWLFMSASVFLLMYFSLFKIYTKLAIILSAGFIYFFPVLARGYSIIPFLIFMAAILYSKQKEHPILYALNIVLLTNTHVIMSVLCFCLTINFIYETVRINIKSKSYNEIKKYVLPILIMLLGFLATILILCHTTSSNICINIKTEDFFETAKRVISLFFLNSVNYSQDYDKILPSTPLEALGVSTIIISYILLFKNLFSYDKKLFGIALSSIGFQLCIYIFAYNAHIYTNRLFCAHIILVFCFWLLLQNKPQNFLKEKTINILISLLFLATIYNGINYTNLDLKLEYSGSKGTAEFIKKNIPSDNSIILADIEAFSIAVAYYLHENPTLYSVKRNKIMKHVIWDKENQSLLSNEDWIKKAQYYNEIEKKNVYALVPYLSKKNELNNIYPKHFQLLYESKINIETREGHRLYKYIGD